MLKSFGTKDCETYFCTPKNEVDLVAQLVEHNTFNVGALGSSPSGITKKAVIRRLFYLGYSIVVRLLCLQRFT
jgi:hypothetical protein